MATRSGSHDRRGFDLVLKLLLGLLAFSLFALIFIHWMVGIAIFLFAGISFVTLEAVSAAPVNNPDNFALWQRRQGHRRPVLLCLGDSLFHGNLSASPTPEIPRELCNILGMDPPKMGAFFADPLWVVNSGQNSITSHTVLHERLNKGLGSHPDFIVLMIGTNDLLSMYSSVYGSYINHINSLPEKPTIAILERNIKKILDFIEQASPNVQVGVCTLPPLGENLKAKSNDLVREANAAIERAVSSAGEKVSLIPVYASLEAILEKKRHRMSLPVDLFVPLSFFMTPIYHILTAFSSWNSLSMLVGNVVMSDGVHLNERGGEVLVDQICEWLMLKSVAKAIAVKS